MYNNELYNTLKEIGQKFRLQGELYSCRAITMGNINSTYKVAYMQEDKKLKFYLFQKVNTHVFKNPVEIMENIDRVTTFIREKYPDQITLHFHHTDEGLNYYLRVSFILKTPYFPSSIAKFQLNSEEEFAI